MAAPCRNKLAEQLLEIGAKAGIAGLAGVAMKDVADKMTSDELDHLVTLKMMGNDEIIGKYLSSLKDKYALPIPVVISLQVQKGSANWKFRSRMGIRELRWSRRISLAAIVPLLPYPLKPSREKMTEYLSIRNQLKILVLAISLSQLTKIVLLVQATSLKERPIQIKSNSKLLLAISTRSQNL